MVISIEENSNVNNVMRTLGTSTHARKDRQIEEYYATDPIAAEYLLKLEPQLNNIVECSCGEGHLAKVFEREHKLQDAFDIIDRGYGSVQDFFNFRNAGGVDIVTNPPFKEAQLFIEHALDIIDDGRYACFFLKIQFLEGKARQKFFLENPPRRIWVSSSRIPCAMNGEFETYDEKRGKYVPVSSAVCYAWYVWEKGYKGKPELGWFN